MDNLKYIIAETQRASSKFMKAISFVPDDKLAYAPTTQCMSAREIGAHIAIVNVAYIAYLLNTPRPYNSFEGLFELSKSEGAKYTSTKSLVADLERSFSTVLEQLRSFPADIITKDVQTVRGTEKALTLLERFAPHIYIHAGQIDYLQTIWGDTEVHI